MPAKDLGFGPDEDKHHHHRPVGEEEEEEEEEEEGDEVRGAAKGGRLATILSRKGGLQAAAKRS